MSVETFTIEEVANETMEHCDKANEIIESLGLTGQQETVGEDKSIRFPYRKITQQEFAVYSMLCPQHCLIQDYKDSPIPLRVLEMAALANEYFDDLFVMYPKAYVKDPVLIGTKGKSGWYESRYIIARWGEELDEFPALLKKAMAMFKVKVKARLTEIKAELEAHMAGFDEVGPSVDSFDSQTLPSFYKR